MAEMTIKRVGVLSVAKLQGLLMAIIGLIIGVMYGLFFMIFGAAMSSFAPQNEGQAIGGLGSIFIGLILMIAIPIFYGVMGFIGGAFGALIYNTAARFVGGIKIELEGAVPYAPPPQWANQY
jgi:Na+/H+-dicarboxylate symporter